jgi:tight adherence protein B
MPVSRRRGFDQWLVQAGLSDVGRREFVAVVATLGAAGTVVGAFLFGSAVPALACGTFAMSFPVASYRQRREARLAAAIDAWPRMIEEIRTLASSAGRSIPQALFEVGANAPPELRGAFDAAHREWLLSTDFRRTLSLLKSKLADATADTVCETLLIAHEVGGSAGRAAYRTPVGQLLVCVAIALVVMCWWWAGRIMRLPRSERVFVE